MSIRDSTYFYQCLKIVQQSEALVYVYTRTKSVYEVKKKYLSSILVLMNRKAIAFISNYLLSKLGMANPDDDANLHTSSAPYIQSHSFLIL